MINYAGKIKTHKPVNWLSPGDLETYFPSFIGTFYTLF